jgi:hypothetical protein
VFTFSCADRGLAKGPIPRPRSPTKCLSDYKTRQNWRPRTATICRVIQEEEEEEEEEEEDVLLKIRIYSITRCFGGFNNYTLAILNAG